MLFSAHVRMYFKAISPYFCFVLASLIPVADHLMFCSLARLSGIWSLKIWLCFFFVNLLR